MFNRLMCRFLLVLPIMAATGYLVGCTSEADWQAHVARALEHRDNGELPAAIIELKNALDARPDAVDARLALGRVYLDMGDGQSAEKELTRANELGAAPASTRVDLTHAYLLQGKFDLIVQAAIDESIVGADQSASLPGDDRAQLAALRGHALLSLERLVAAQDYYDKALSQAPDSAQAALGKARLAVARGDVEAARTRLEALVKDHAEFAPAWNLLGDLERSQGNMVAAEAAYGEAIEHAFDKWQALTSRAFVRIARNDDAGAAADLKKMRGAGASHPSAIFAQGLLDYRAHELGKAQAAFEDVVRKAPNYMPAVFYLGVVHALAGQQQQVEFHLKRYLRVDPRSDEAALILGAARLLGNDYAGAEAVLKPLLARRPGDGQVRTLLGSATLRRGGGDTGETHAELAEVAAQQAESATARFLGHVSEVAAGSRRREMQAAKRFIDAVEANALDDPNQLLSLGIAKLELGDVAGSTTELEKAIALDPELVGAQATLIVDKIRTKDLESALAQTQELIKKHPQRTIGYNMLGVVRAGQRDPEGAKDAFRRALEIDATDPDAAHNLASVLFIEEKFEDAREAYLTVLKRRPGQVNALLRLALIEARLGTQEKALDWLEQAVAGAPDYPLPRAALGRVYLKQGRDDEALRLTEAFARRDDAGPAVLQVLATAQLRKNLFSAAMPTLQRLSELQPESAAVQRRLTMVYQELGRSADALAASGRALSLAPTHRPTMYLRARLLLGAGKFNEARQLVAALQAEGTPSSELLDLEGRIAMRQAKTDEGIAAYRRAFELRPHNLQLWKLAEALFAAGRNDEGTALFNSWLAEHPQDSMILWALARHHIRQERYADVQVPLAKLIALHPDSADAQNELAWVLLQQRRFPEALVHATRANELRPDDAQVLDTLGTILLEMGETDRALSLLRNAVQAASADPAIETNLARALVAIGQMEEARHYLSKALSDARAFANRAEAERLLDSIGK